MKSAGIVSEFNPIHNGHRYLIDSVRERFSPDAVICVMSGNFMQRGEPAVCSKRDRAAMALSCGADLVVELPVCFALNCAGEFAKGAVRIMKGLGVDAIAFGSESGDIEKLTSRAERLIIEDPQFVTALKSSLEEGLSYPAAMGAALGEEPGPNDILAQEYLKENMIQKAGLEPICVTRVGEGHRSLEISGNYASASALRKMLVNGTRASQLNWYMPKKACDILDSAYCYDTEAEKRLFTLIRFALIVSSAEQIGGLVSSYGGIENRLKEAVLKADSLDALIKLAKSRRYTYSGIARILIQLLLGMNAEEYAVISDSSGIYARVLGFNDKGAAFLREKRKSAAIPILSNEGNLPDDPLLKIMAELDRKASALYSIICSNEIYSGSDFVMKPVVL